MISHSLVLLSQANLLHLHWEMVSGIRCVVHKRVLISGCNFNKKEEAKKKHSHPSPFNFPSHIQQHHPLSLPLLLHPRIQTTQSHKFGWVSGWRRRRRRGFSFWCATHSKGLDSQPSQHDSRLGATFDILRSRKRSPIFIPTSMPRF
jgi:hypothetical protein